MGAWSSKSSHGAREAAGPLRKRLRLCSAPRDHDEDGNHIENVSMGNVTDSAVSNEDGRMQLVNEEWQSLLSSCLPTGGVSDDPSGSTQNVHQMSHDASGAGGPLRKRLRSTASEHEWNGKCIEDVNNDDVRDSEVLNHDGLMQLAKEELPSLLFSCEPMGAQSDHPSGIPCNVQQMSLFKLDGAKHKIFLSHSGAQKDFVEQLCVDLERHGYFFPFFDERHHSLPKGKDFAPLIIEAARLCHVAVIVLSEEFLSSKWPMLELTEFYSAQQQRGVLHMLPLFFKLSIEEVKDEDRWMPIWKQHACKDKRIDVTKWSAAVKALCKTNGLRFEKDAMKKEVAYRKLVVENILKLSPPDLLHGSSESMVGYNRMCKEISSLFVKNTTIGADVLGLYGMAGVGKTTLSKAMCDYFYGEFLGKVCHVELGKGPRAWRQENLLKTLCGFEKNMLDVIGMDFEKRLTQLRLHMRREPVLLVIDNVTNDIHLQMEARMYLMVGFHPKSKIMIVAKSKAILEDLLPNIEFIMSMPELHKEEAGELFLQHAAPMKSIYKLTYEERNIVEICTWKCWFETDKGGSYHPLALTALADFFSRLGRSKDNQMLVWKDHIDMGMVTMRDVWSSSKGLFDILDMQFSTYKFDEKLLFLDIAYFVRNNWLLNSTLNGLVKFYSRLYDESPAKIRKQLEDLEKSGMISMEIFVNPDYELVPDLYKEFAEWYVTEHNVKGLKNVCGVFQTMGTNLRGDASSSSRKWVDLVRLRIIDISRANARLLLGKAMQEMSNLVVLQLRKCPNIEVLNLKGLDCLRRLELFELTNLVTMLLPGNSSTDEYSGIYDSLQHVELKSLDNLCNLPDFRPCTSLHSFSLVRCARLRNLGVLECPQLKELTIAGISLGQYNYDEEFKFEGLPDLKALHSLVWLRVSTEWSNGIPGYFNALWEQATGDKYIDNMEIHMDKDGYFGKLFDKLHTACLQKWKFMRVYKNEEHGF